MKIQIKTRNNNFRLLLPLQLLRFLPYSVLNIFLKGRTLKEKTVMIKRINPRMVRQSLKVLRQYKGFNILEASSSDGSEVRIVI